MVLPQSRLLEPGSGLQARLNCPWDVNPFLSLLNAAASCAKDQVVAWHNDGVGELDIPMRNVDNLRCNHWFVRKAALPCVT